MTIDGREYPGKDALLRELEAAWAAWDALVARAGGRLTEPFQGDWSIRDVVAHMTAYDRFLALSIDGNVRPVPEMPQEIGFDVERRNQFMHAADRDVPLEQVMAEAPAVRAELLAHLRERTDEQLQTARHMPWHEWPLWRWVVTGHEHYQDHVAHLRRWLDGR